jgi:hypothetical protein
MKQLLALALMFFLSMAPIVLAEGFREKVLMSPDVAILWNFQRGAEEFFRMTKFSSIMRIQYSLDLMERRIGEMDLLFNKSEGSLVPMIENNYELEVDKLADQMNTTDLFSIVMTNADVRENVTQRLRYDIKVLGDVKIGNATKETKDYVNSAVKKTSFCIDFINKL